MSIWQEPYLLAPSLITLDLLNLESQVKTLEASGFSCLHLDILDGYFSPSMPLGLDTIRQLRQKTDLAFDCHLMAKSNDFFIDELLDIGVQQIVFHVETERHVDGMLNKIKQKGVRAGVALKPSTSLTTLDYILEKCDTVLLMLINPGFASMPNESQVDYAERKIKELKAKIKERDARTKISIDGRISKENIRTYGNNLVDQFVCGSTCLEKDHLEVTAGELIKFKEKLMLEKWMR